MTRSTRKVGPGALATALPAAALWLVVAGVGTAAAVQTSPPCAAVREPRPRFPTIPVWAYPGVYQDSSTIRPHRCVGSFGGPQPDSIRPQPRTVTVRFLRDRRAEARSDFGGYRIYRVTVDPDTARMVLVRRFSRQSGDEITWNFSVVDTSDSSTLPFRCQGEVVHDSVVTFVDPDSSHRYIKVCRIRIPNTPTGVCQTPGDSILILVPPPGPHDGFRTWYSVTYEARNLTADSNFEDMFVPDTEGLLDTCRVRGDPRTCANLNNKCYNLMARPVEPTRGPTSDLERIGVVPNPFRARVAWDRPGGNEVHFINLPGRATIWIYTAAGDLVTRIEHAPNPGDAAERRDFARWNLKNQEGRDVASGIYMYRVETDRFKAQDRFVVIR